MRLTTSLTGLVASLLLAAVLPAHAFTLQLTVTGHVDEPLVTRGKDFKLAPALAMPWKYIKVGK